MREAIITSGSVVAIAESMNPIDSQLIFRFKHPLDTLAIYIRWKGNFPNMSLLPRGRMDVYNLRNATSMSGTGDQPMEQDERESFERGSGSVVTYHVFPVARLPYPN